MTATFLVASGVGAGPTQAEQATLQDRSRDVVDSGQERVQPNVAGNDVVHVRARHTNLNVVVSALFRDIRKSARLQVQFFVVVNGNYSAAVVTATRANPAGTISFGNDDSDFVCRNAAHRVDYRRNTVKVRADRSCFGNPKRVQVGVVANLASQRFYDIAGSDGAEDGLIGPVLTRRLAAGSHTPN